jgi:hypothetical protein
VCGHDLHRLGNVTIPERSAQIRVPDQHRLRAVAQQLDVERPVDIDHELHAVQVDAVLGQPV